jgi:radical SAM superfamily enzyme YgiQ (UPF0313 family)
VRVAVVVAWRPKGVAEWDGRRSAAADGLPRALAYDRTAPPYTGVHLASLLPRDWEVELIHEGVRDVDGDSNFQAVFLSTMDYAAPHARRLAAKFRLRGTKVIVGGLYATINPNYFSDVADTVIIGEAEPVLARLIADLRKNQLAPIYKAEAPADLSDLPVPRYELVEPDYAVPMTYEATRGCPFRCSFCALSAMPSPYRRRPIANVIRDLQSAPSSWSSMKRKHVFLWDNNLGADRRYFRNLAEELIPLKMIWGTQTSIDTITPDVARLLGKSGCRILYIGLESLSAESLRESNKRQNHVAEYKQVLEWLHDNGILVMSIFLIGLDGDTQDYLERLPELVEKIGVDVPVFSLAAPIEGTPFRNMLTRENRLLAGDLNYAMDGSRLVYRPRTLIADDVEPSLYRIMQQVYKPSWLIRRIVRRFSGGFESALIAAGMNLSYRAYELAIAKRGFERVRARGPWPGEGLELLRAGSEVTTQ